jgi:multiple sugar transport system permease protein
MKAEAVIVSLPKRHKYKSIFKSVRGQKILVAVTFMMVPLFLLCLFTYLPFVKMAQFSLYQMKYIGTRIFIGLENYKDVFTRTEILGSLRLSLYYLAASLVQLSLALFFACILSVKTEWNGFFKGVIFFPYLVCGIAIGFMFKFFFTRGFVLDSVLGSLGFNQDKLPYWLRDARVNNIMLAATSVWRYMGQNMVLFIGAITSIDPLLYEAADIDGASTWNKFRYIMLPGISSIVVLNMILAVSGSISAFEPPYVITNGTFDTATYFVTMHSMAHEKQKVGLASAMAIVLMLIIILITLLQRFISRTFFEEDQHGYVYSERRAMRKRAKVQAAQGEQKHDEG